MSAEPTAFASLPRTAPRSRGGPGFISIAFMAGLVFAPVAVATGLLTDVWARPQVPADVTVSALRPTFDAASAEPADPSR